MYVTDLLYSMYKMDHMHDRGKMYEEKIEDRDREEDREDREKDVHKRAMYSIKDWEI